MNQQDRKQWSRRISRAGIVVEDAVYEENDEGFLNRLRALENIVHRAIAAVQGGAE
jgi:hypothetical protein